MREEPQGRGSGSAIERLLRLHPVATFYVLAFTISWLGYVPLLLRSGGHSWFASPLCDAALVLPGAGPGIAAAMASWKTGNGADEEGSAWVRLRRAFLRRVPLRWWVATVLLAVGMMFVAALLTRYLVPGHAGIVRRVASPGFLLFAGISLIANPIEEIGWRGFAQTRLEADRTALHAAGIVGLLWAAWHLPLFLLSSGPVSMAQVSFWPWAAGMVPQAVLLAWLYHRTGRSLGAVSLFHFLGNLAGMVFESSVAMVSGVRLVTALVVIMVAGVNLGCGEALATEENEDGVAER